MENQNPEMELVDQKIGVASQNAHIEDVVEVDDSTFRWNFDVCTNLLALYLIYFASTWALSVPSSSIAFIMYEFPTVPYTTTAWVAAAPSLCLCVVQIFLGDISDIFGRKWFLVFASVTGVAGMLVAGRGTTIEMIIGGQVLNGIALTFGYLSTPLLAEVVPKRYRAPILGGGTFLASLAGVAGQISQGAFMKYAVGGQNKGWRIGLYIGAGFFFLAFINLLVFYHPGGRPNPEGFSLRKRFVKIDWLGIFLGTSGLLLFLIGLQYGGSSYAWDSARVLAFLIVGGVTFLVFIAWEWKGAREGLFPPSLFQHRNYAVTLALNFVEGMVIFSSQSFLPQITLALITSDVIMTGVCNLPNAGGAIAGVVFAAVVATKTKEAKFVAVAGVASLTFGGGLMAVMRPNISFAAYFFPVALIGVGVGSLGVIIPVISTVCTPNRYIATSVAVGSSVRGLGGAIGVVVFSQIFSSKLSKLLPSLVTKAVIAAGLPASSVQELILASASHNAQLIQSIPGVTPAILAALQKSTEEAYARSFRYIWYSLLPFCVLTFGLSFLLKSTKDQMTLQVASAVEQRHATRDENAAKHLSDA